MDDVKNYTKTQNRSLNENNKIYLPRESRKNKSSKMHLKI